MHLITSVVLLISFLIKLMKLNGTNHIHFKTLQMPAGSVIVMLILHLICFFCQNVHGQTIPGNFTLFHLVH